MMSQTPNSPINAGSSGGRKTSKRLILVSHGATQSNVEVSFPISGDEPMNMLGVIQSQKTAELLLDLKVSSIVCSPRIASVDTATAISKVQEAADCLGADCIPHYVEVKQMQDLEVERVFCRVGKNSTSVSLLQPGWLAGSEEGVIAELWDQSKKSWNLLLDELSDESEPGKNVVVIGHPMLHITLIGHCLNLTTEQLGYFHLDAGSVSVIDFPDGPRGRGIIRCVNYTAHLGRWSIPVTRSMTDDEDF